MDKNVCTSPLFLVFCMQSKFEQKVINRHNSEVILGGGGGWWLVHGGGGGIIILCHIT